jgi:hypothetical protein
VRIENDINAAEDGRVMQAALKFSRWIITACEEPSARLMHISCDANSHVWEQLLYRVAGTSAALCLALPCTACGSPTFAAMMQCRYSSHCYNPELAVEHQLWFGFEQGFEQVETGI